MIGRLLCALGRHHFGGWPTHSPGPLPMAFCSRCGREF